MSKVTGRTMNDIIASFSPERQKLIREGANELITEYKSLQEFRKAIGWTQEELADKLELKQANISQLEKRDDMHLSTLRKYVEAMGYELEINIKVPSDSTRVKLSNLNF